MGGGQEGEGKERGGKRSEGMRMGRDRRYRILWVEERIMRRSGQQAGEKYSKCIFVHRRIWNR